MAVVSCPVDVKTIRNVDRSNPVWQVPVFLCRHRNVSETTIVEIDSSANLGFVFRGPDALQTEIVLIASAAIADNVYQKHLNVCRIPIVRLGKFAQAASVKNSLQSVEATEIVVLVSSVVKTNAYLAAKRVATVPTGRFVTTERVDQMWSVR
jgi:hypothetical protein